VSDDNNRKSVESTTMNKHGELDGSTPNSLGQPVSVDASGKKILDQGRGAKETAKEQAKLKAQRAAARRNTERNFQNLQQCLLTENLNMISNYHKQNNDLFQYQTFRQINGSSHKIVNDLRGVANIDSLLNIRTAVLSLLQPKIRIYKVVYSKGQRNPGQKGGPVDTMVPTYKEIKFSDSFGSEAARTVREYLNHEMTKPNWRNVGLESFNFHQLGRKYGAQEHNIRCQMVLSAKGLKDLLATSPGSDARYIDLLLFPESAGQKSQDTFRPNPKHYQIKAFIGYSKPPSSAIKNIGLSSAEREFLKNIEKFNFLVTLTMHSYDFQIAENGQTEVTIDFWGSIGTATGAGTNVFDNSMVVKEGVGTKIVPKNREGHSFREMSDITTILGKVVTAHKNPDSAKESPEELGRELLEKKMFRDLYKDTFEEPIKPNFSVSDVNSAVENLTSKKGSAAFLASLRRASGGLKNEVYKSFMLQLLDGDLNKGGDTRLFAISVNKENLDNALGIIQAPAGDDKERKKEEIKRNTSNAIGLAAQSVRIGRPTDIAGIKKSIEAVEGSANENVSDAGSESRAQEKIQTVEGATKASLITSKTKGDRYEFYYVYLGDIIELAAKNSGMFAIFNDKKPVYNLQSYNKKEQGSEYGLTNMRFLLGPLEYAAADGKIRRINIAEFPISFDLFRAWFIEKVVREDRSKMTFKGFLGSLFNNLVVPAMGAECLTPIKMGNVQFQNIFMTLPGKSADSPNTSKPTEFLTEEALPMDKKIDIASPGFKEYTRLAQSVTPHESFVRNSYDYQLVQTSGYKAITERSGNCKEDAKDGIYHFNIGSDRGLLTRMNFKKVDIPHQQERMSKIAIDQGKNQLAQLAFTFDCDLEMIGNTLFIPGMVFYANPSFAGLGNPQQKGSVSNQLNIGGYYIILETKLDIAPGKFTSNVIAKYIAHGSAQ
tara:strand:+ start:1041 stop:3863 length:2823 start_codon:yes stop_codon:yes gene_type:complete